MLQIQSLRKTYKGSATPAVSNLSIDVRPGEIFGFLGPNGAGKTTTIKMIVGLLNPDSGRVLINGTDVAAEPVKAKSMMGFVPDNPDLYERVTGIEYLNFIGDIFGVPADVRKRRISELLETFELSHAVGDLIQSYSHGMKQKLALISAMFHQPRLLVLDEPMVGLDPKSAHTFKALMREHCERGNVVFFSTHILEVAEKLCDRVGIINKGELIACGTVEELREHRRAAGESLERIFLELTGNGGERI